MRVRRLSSPGHHLGRRPRGPILYAFAGMAGHWAGMGRALYTAEPAFREGVDACCAAASADDMFIAEAFAGPGYVAPDDPSVARRREIMLLGVVQLALVDLLREAGIEPDATLALSLGEITAAYAAGAFTRAQAMAVLDAVASSGGGPAQHGMLLVVDADLTTVRRLCRTAPARLEFLGTTSPNSAIAYVSDEDGDEAVAFVERRCLIHRRYRVRWPVHTMLKGYDRRHFESHLAGLAPQRSRVPMFSSMAGRDIAPAARFDALHWYYVTGHAFLFAEATAAALAINPGVIVHIGAQPVLRPWLASSAAHLGVALPLVDTMRREDEIGVWREARARLRSVSGRPAAVRSSPATDGAAEEVHVVASDEAWTLNGYELVRDALRSPAQFSSRILQRFDPVLLGADPPAQTRARRTIAPLLSASAVEAITPFAQRTARDLLGHLAEAVEFDLVSAYAEPLAERVAERLLGSDDADTVLTRAGPAESPFGGAAVEEVAELLESRTAPGWHFAEQLTADSELDESELESLGRVLWVAATSTTKHSIVAAVLAALREPQLRAQITSPTADLDGYVDEVLRRDSPLRIAARQSTEDLSVAGASIPAGRPVRLCLHAANHDPRIYPEPDRLIPGREPRHLAFGGGPHRCPGAKLARMEIAVALRELFAALPELRLVQPECALRWSTDPVTRALEQLMLAPG